MKIKVLFIWLTAVLFADYLTSEAQSVPSLINYQGRLSDAAGNPIPSGTYGVAFRLWSKKDAAQEGNKLVWGQEYAVTVLNGLFNVILGAPGGTPIPGAAVNDLGFAFSDAERYFGITISKGTNGLPILNTSEITPRQQILATPYALTASFAGTAQNVVNGTPSGTILAIGSLQIPTGYLPCDGSAVSRTEYASLFGAIGTLYGSGDGASTFNLPDLRGRVPVGYDLSQSEFDTLGKKGGEKTHTLTVSEIPSLAIKFSRYFDSTSPAPSLGGDDINNRMDCFTQAGGQPHNNLQPFLVVKYIIEK